METSAAVAKENAKETANAEHDNARFGFLGQGGAVVSSKFSKGFFQGFFPNGFSKGFSQCVFQGFPIFRGFPNSYLRIF